ncbi:thromboxane-A synthase isoform X3 [Octopus vulgaris]|uniref:Thromboxane-A synthase isoform X3 n=1 Tax=Octopus vulgaris TaxID=6645 RepID=A0AA36BVK8_OCTVU|nr:thromboxane-A synthase isoform X3 [Octopus vulgaris]
MYVILLLLTLILVYLLYSIYSYGAKPFTLFKSHGIPGPEPKHFIGNLDSFKKPRYLLEKEWCKKFGSVTGYFIGRNPYLLITDLQMIKTIMSTNFANFRNRPFDVPTDDFTELFLMNTKDQYWKFLRTLMMTAFSNKKLKESLYLMKVCVANFVTNISQDAASGKEFCINHSYTMDIIAATGFGIEINSQMNMNHPFVLHAKALFKPGFLKYLIALTFVFPFLWHLVNVYIILAGERKHRNFFAAICRDTILFRRNNPEIVGDVTFENLQQLKYLDMCLAEVLRLYPVSPRTNRIAAKESVIQGWTIPTEADVVFPIYTIHHDPEIWPEPEKFDPERFRAENSEGRHPYSYLPFGGGPRMCMGPKFAQLESKLAIVEILRSYELLPCERTEIPVELDDNFLLAPKNGIWLKVEKRKDT